MEIGLSWALRTPLGKKQGQWAKIPPERLMGRLIQEATHRFPLPDQVILGTAVTTGGNAGRVACLSGSLPITTPALTLDAQCLGGAQAIWMARSQLLAGQAKTVWAGGMESASLIPRRGYHPQDPRFEPAQPFYQTAQFTPWDDQQPMTARMTPWLAEFPPKALIDWGLNSKEKAWEARLQGWLDGLLWPQDGTDELVHPPKSTETWARILQRYPATGIHPLNCASEADGAALIGLTTEPTPWRLKGGKWVAGDPARAAFAYMPAVQALLEEFKLDPKNIDLWEIHEAFAMKPLAAVQEWGLNPQKINIFGGNLAYGHPFGASGAIGVMHLMRALERKKARLGIFAMAAAGGQGIALLLEYSK